MTTDPALESRAENAPGWLERRVAPLALRVTSSPAVDALQKALPIAFIVLLVVVVPYVAFVATGTIPSRIRASIAPGFSLMSVALVVILSARLARGYRYHPALPIVAALIAFGLTLPPAALFSFAAFSATLGAAGPFTAIVVALAIAVLINVGRRRFGALPGLVLGCIAAVAAFGLINITGFSLAGALDAMLRPLGHLGDSLFALALICALESALWIVGIHGPALLAALVLPIYADLQFANFEAWSHHQPLPHIVVISTFLFVFPGGAGATLPLALLLARSRVPRLRRLALASLLPGVAGTNEPLLFGLPIVFNIFLAVPFIVTPVVLVATTYAAIALGAVARPYVYMPATVPFPLGVYLATLDWRAVILAVVNVAIGALIYAPFVRAYERAEALREKRAQAA